MQLTDLQLVGIMPAASARAAKWAPHLNAAADRWQINTPLRLAAWLAQLAHESAELSRVVENLNYSRADRLLAVFPRDFKDLADAARFVHRPEQTANRVYAGQNGNGNELSGDGWRFRGRGLIQITGRDNYRNCSIGLFGHPSRLLTNPELLERPEHAAGSAGWYWQTHGCNELADASEVKSITRRINGGLNGYAERLAYNLRAREVLGC